MFSSLRVVKSMALQPFRSFIFWSAPLARRITTLPALPQSAASISGVLPWSLRLLIRAPWSRKHGYHPRIPFRCYHGQYRVSIVAFSRDQEVSVGGCMKNLSYFSFVTEDTMAHCCCDGVLSPGDLFTCCIIHDRKCLLFCSAFQQGLRYLIIIMHTKL